MIGIRADANEIIATGHIMRCIAIAQQLEKQGQEVAFITSDYYATSLLAKKGFQAICLNSDWKEKDQEVEELIQCIKDNRIDKLIIDSYQVTYNYLQILKKYTKIIYIDDLYQFEYPVDMLINYTIQIDETQYGYLDEKVIKLLGSSYVPLREEFQNRKIHNGKRVTNILFTTGGSDLFQIMPHLIKAVMNQSVFSSINFHVIVGAFFTNKEELVELAHENHNILLYENVDNIAKVMEKCDLAVSAGGTTLAELSSMAIPTISFAIADNQLAGVGAFTEEAGMPSVGDIRQDIEQGVNNILEWLHKLINNLELREFIGQREVACIDGLGATRIAEEINRL